MNLFAVVKARIIKGFMIRNGYVGSEHVVAQWLRFLQLKTSLKGTWTDLEKIWLRTNGATGNTLRDLWVDFLSKEGYAGNETGMRQFFENWTQAAPASGGMAVPALAALWTLE